MPRSDDDNPAPKPDDADRTTSDEDEVGEPPDTTTDSGLVGGVDEPNESTDALVDPTVPSPARPPATP